MLIKYIRFYWVREGRGVVVGLLVKLYSILVCDYFVIKKFNYYCCGFIFKCSVIE